MIYPSAPFHSKHSVGEPAWLRELRYRFKKSESASRLIDYVRDTDVDVIESTTDLELKGWGGGYDIDKRVVHYSGRKAAINLFHEFRHAQQNDTIQLENPEWKRDYHHLDLRRAFMAVAIQETDACYSQQIIYDEMRSRADFDPFLFFKVFMGESINPWLASTASDNFVRKSPFYGLYKMGWGATIQHLENAYDAHLIERKNEQNSHNISVSHDQKWKEMEYLRQYSDLVCRDKNGENYLVKGLNGPDAAKVIEEIWSRIFVPDRDPVFWLEAKKDRRLEQISRVKSGVSKIFDAFPRF